MSTSAQPKRFCSSLKTMFDTASGTHTNPASFKPIRPNSRLMFFVIDCRQTMTLISARIVEPTEPTGTSTSLPSTSNRLGTTFSTDKSLNSGLFSASRRMLSTRVLLTGRPSLISRSTTIISERTERASTPINTLLTRRGLICLCC